MTGFVLWLAATPSPTETRDLSDPVVVSPGLIGFLATFALVVATVLLIIDMNRRIRRLRFRERQAAAAARERAASAGTGGPGGGRAGAGGGGGPGSSTDLPDDLRPPGRPRNDLPPG